MRLHSIVRRDYALPSPFSSYDDPTRLPFWSRPISIFGLLKVTDPTNVHLRSTFRSPLGLLQFDATRCRPLSQGLRTLGHPFARPSSGTRVDGDSDCRILLSY